MVAEDSSRLRHTQDVVAVNRPLRHEPTPQHEKPVRKPKKFLRRRNLLISLVLIVLVGLGTWAFLYYKATYTGYFPRSIRNQVHLALYYPFNAPDGLSVDRSSFEVPHKNVVIYTVYDNKNNPYYISLQPNPTEFNMTAFRQKFLSTSNITVPIGGNAFTADLGSEFVASIQTPKNTWILINTPNVGYPSELQSLCFSLRQSK
jgi:hypothetical protein